MNIHGKSIFDRIILMAAYSQLGREPEEVSLRDKIRDKIAVALDSFLAKISHHYANRRATLSHQVMVEEAEKYASISQAANKVLSPVLDSPLPIPPVSEGEHPEPIAENSLSDSNSEKVADLEQEGPQVKEELPTAEAKLDDLESEIRHLKRGDSTQKKKAALLEQGLTLFRQKNCRIDLETFRLTNTDNFKLSYDNSTSSYTAIPSYFNEKFKATHHLTLEVTALFYDYESTDSESEDFWVDFANASLGGGCFTHGFVQEEVMVHEMPDFAAHIAGNLSSLKEGWCDTFTREGNLDDRNRVMQGTPNPYLLKGIHRVQAVDSHLAYSKIDHLSTEELLNSTTPLATPQKVNLLAIAAPKLFTRNPKEQWHPLTLEDNFNTLMAGFQLIKEQSNHPIIHSGKIGCGAFNNDIHAIYLLHCLASQQTGLKVKLHGYSQTEAADFQRSWNTLAPQLNNRSLKECLGIISKHLERWHQT